MSRGTGPRATFSKGDFEMSIQEKRLLSVLAGIDFEPGTIESLVANADEMRPILLRIASGKESKADRYMRKNAIGLLGHVADVGSVKVLADLLGHDRVEYRANAIRSLGRIDDPKAAKALQAHLTKTDLPLSEGKVTVLCLEKFGPRAATTAIKTFRDRFEREKKTSPGLKRDLKTFDEVTKTIETRT